MEFLEVFFPASGVRTSVLLPPLVALVISFVSSMGGVSGAFLILPFQMSVLGYTAPSVSATNFVYNIAAIPSGVYRYVREGRMNWPLTWAIVAGTLPGLVAGFYVRIRYLPDPRHFKVFVGLVLLYVSARLLRDALRPSPPSPPQGPFSLRIVRATLSRVEYDFQGQRHGFSVRAVLLLSLFVGIIGGVYGIGGGAIIAPFVVAVLGLPIHTVAGATLMGTFVSSIAGVAFYSVLPSTLHTAPDWPLGLLFGAGGFVGMYLGARAQRRVPQRFIKAILGAVIIILALRYVTGL